MVGFRVFDVGLLIVWLVWFFRLRDDDDDTKGDDGRRRRAPRAARQGGPGGGGLRLPLGGEAGRAAATDRTTAVPRRPADAGRSRRSDPPPPSACAGRDRRCPRITSASSGAHAPNPRPCRPALATGARVFAQYSSKRSAALPDGRRVSFSGESAGGSGVGRPPRPAVRARRDRVGSALGPGCRLGLRRRGAIVSVWSSRRRRLLGRRDRQLRRLDGGCEAGSSSPPQREATASASSATTRALRGERSALTAGSRRPQCGQSLTSVGASCSSEQPHRRRFSTAQGRLRRVTARAGGPCRRP